MKSSRNNQPSMAKGILSSVIGYHIATARVTTQELFVRHIGEPFSLRPVEFSLLMLLQAHGHLTPKQLSRLLALPGPNLSMLLDRIQDRGLVERVRSAVDRRSQQILLTSAGQELVHRLEARVPGMEVELDAVLSPAERAMLIELLQKVAAHGGSGRDTPAGPESARPGEADED